MDNDMKLYLSMNYDEQKSTTGDDMHNALTSIAKEIQRFRAESEARKQKIIINDQDCDIPLQTNSNAVIFETKNEQVKNLKKNLKTVYNVAKIVLSAKHRETELLLSNLHNIRKESSHLTKNNAENLNLIQHLRIENYNINNEIQFLCNFIHMAYKKLQKMRNEFPKEMPFIEELKTILIACGQYYADYCKAREQCDQLERRNRFLKNKLKIVENNLTAATEELRNLRSLNMKLSKKSEMDHKQNDAFYTRIKSSNVSEMTFDLNSVSSDENKTDCYNAHILKYNENKRNLKMANNSLCLLSHFETVRNLLLDQDDMLKMLNELYLDLLTPDS